MSSNNADPKWWRLYLIFPLLIALFAVDSRLKLSVREHQIVQILILLTSFGYMVLWLKANAKALSAMDQAQDGGQVKVIKILPYQLPATDDEKTKRPMFRISGSEIKGVLSDTFEMDVIDAEFYSVDNVTHDSKKD